MAKSKELMIANPKFPLKDLQAQLAAEGFSPAASTVPTIRTDFLHSLKMLQAAGYAGELVID